MPSRFALGSASGSESGLDGCLRKSFEGGAVPAGGKDDRLPVRREACRPDRAAAERDLLVGGRRDPCEALLEERAGRERRDRSAATAITALDPRRRAAERGAAAPETSGAGDGRVGQVLPDALQVAGEIARRGVALFRVLLKAPFHEPSERPRDVRREPSERLGLLADDRRERLGARRALERALAGGHLVEDRTEGELVGAEVDRLAARLLGRHVADGAHHRSRARGAVGMSVPSDGWSFRIFARPKSRILTTPSFDTITFSGFRSRCTIPAACAFARPSAICPERSRSFFDGERTGGESLAQGLSVDELHRENVARRGTRGTGELFEGIDGRDVRVVERREQLRFLLEAPPAVLVFEEILRQDLQRHDSLEPRVAGPIDLAHPSGSEGGEDLVRSELLSRGERHACGAGAVITACRSSSACRPSRRRLPGSSRPFRRRAWARPSSSR